MQLYPEPVISYLQLFSPEDVCSYSYNGLMQFFTSVMRLMQRNLLIYPKN